MRKTLITLSLALGLATSANADQATLTALQNAGISLTQAESDSLRLAAISDTTTCEPLASEIAGLVANNAANDQAITTILTEASNIHSTCANAFGEASMASAPQAIALIAELLTDIAPTAAGGQGLNNAPGLNIARSNANVNNRIPTPNGGGGSSSPN